MSKLSRAKVVCATDYQPCNMKPKTLPLTKTALGKNVPVQSIGFTGNSLVLDFVGRLAFWTVMQYHSFFLKKSGLKGRVRMILSGLVPAFITCLLIYQIKQLYLPVHCQKIILFIITLLSEKAFIAFRNQVFIFGIEIQSYWQWNSTILATIVICLVICLVTIYLGHLSFERFSCSIEQKNWPMSMGKFRLRNELSIILLHYTFWH